MRDKANEHTPGSESSARGKRHTAKPSPKKALAGGGKPKFTPGPWVTLDGLEGPEDIADARGEMLATTYPMSFGKGSSVANAHLIATAPDGYRLAEMVVSYFGDDKIPVILDADIALRDAARALLAKARGENASKHVNRKPMKAQ